MKKLEQAYRQCNKSETSDQAGQAPEPKARNKNTLRFFSHNCKSTLCTSFHKNKVFRVRFQIDILAVHVKVDYVKNGK